MLAALNLSVRTALAAHGGYSSASTWTMVPVLAAMIVMTLVSTEAKGIEFGTTGTATGLAATPQSSPADGGIRADTRRRRRRAVTGG